MQPRVLDLKTTPIVETRLSMDALQPKWTGEVGGVALAVIPKKESGGFRIDLELKW